MVFSICMLMLIVCEPILAEDVYNTEIKYGEISIPWGNGIDDDGDGVIDNWGEADVMLGTMNVSADAHVVPDTWNTTFVWPGNMESGVQVGAYADEIWEIWSNENISVAPTQTCYFLNLDYLVSNYSGYDTVSDVLNVLRFYVNMSPKDIMNGAQEFWYRSPLVWNDVDNDYEAHYLNIYDEDNNLVYASTNETYLYPDPKYVTDNSSLEGIGGERVYYKLNMNFRSNKRYRFEEFVEIVDDNSVNTVKLYMARGQDIADDGETSTYVFIGSSHGRKVPAECSWSAVFTIGIGRAGTEKLLLSDPDYTSTILPHIFTHKFDGDGDTDNTGNATFVVPIRTTIPLNISISYRVWSGGDFNNWVSPADPTLGVLRNVTGTLIFRIPINDPNVSAPNQYQLCFTLLNFNVSDEAMTFIMYPSVGDTCMVNYGILGTNYSVNHFAMHIEVANENEPLPERDESVSIMEALVGFNILVMGVFFRLVQIVTGVDIPLEVSGVPIGALIRIGDRMILESGVLEAGGILGILSAGGGRAISGFIKGISHIAGLIQNIVIKGIEILKDLGNAVLHWGGIIFEAVVQIIYLIAFLAVVWIWAKFLKIMTGVVRGDIDAALATTTEVIGKGTKVVKKVYRPARKAGKAGIRFGTYLKGRRKR